MSTNDSSLLDPPTTIEISDDDDEFNNISSNFVPKEVKTEEKKFQHHGFELSSSTSEMTFERKRTNATADDTNPNTTNVTTETSTDAALSPDIDQVIKGFQQELDTLSDSLDKMAAARSQTKRDMLASVSTKENPPPPPHETLAPKTYHSDYGTRTPIAGTTVNRNDHHREMHSSNHRTTSVYSSSYHHEHTPTHRMEEPPRPVDTPLVSAAGSSIRTNQYYSGRSKNDALSDRDEFRYGNNNESYDGGIASTTTQQTTTIQKLKELLEERNQLIHRLQHENHELRKQLTHQKQQQQQQQHYGDPTNDAAAYKAKHQQNGVSRQGPSLQPMFDGSNRPRNHLSDNFNSNAHYYINGVPTTPTRQTSNHRPEPHEHYSNYYDDEPMRPTTSSLTTMRSTDLLRTAHRDDEDDENTTLFDATTSHRRAGGTTVSGFTPGTKFVAELTKHMKIQQGHNVPLSVIIDKHWDKLKLHMRDDMATNHTANDY